jgi:hypothetical protein
MAFTEIELITTANTKPVFSMTHGAHESAVMTLRDKDGCIIDLTPFVCDSGDPDVEPPCNLRALPIDCGAYFYVASYQGQHIKELEKELVIYGDPEDGQVLIDIEPCDICLPGQYLAQVVLILDQEIRFSFPMYLEATPSLSWTYSGPLTIAEIRLWTRDHDPHFNDLLDEVEYKDAEVVAAIRRGVDLWNSTPPVLRAHTYGPSTFPQQYRSQWIDVTIGFLKSIAADWYDRNNLAYSADGVSINDRNKGPIYRQDAQIKIAEYKNWLKDIKTALNMDGAWGRRGYRSLP